MRLARGDRFPEAVGQGRSCFSEYASGGMGSAYGPCDRFSRFSLDSEASFSAGAGRTRPDQRTSILASWPRVAASRASRVTKGASRTSARAT